MMHCTVNLAGRHNDKERRYTRGGVICTGTLQYSSNVDRTCVALVDRRPCRQYFKGYIRVNLAPLRRHAKLPVISSGAEPPEKKNTR